VATLNKKKGKITGGRQGKRHEKKRNEKKRKEKILLKAFSLSSSSDSPLLLL